MRKWSKPELAELNLKATENLGNNDTHTHKGWCKMHKHPELGICTCGADAEIEDSLS
ncbi:MAG: hypothetical protein ACI4F8_01355 [Lachnospiraceae bacterium]